MNFSSQGIENFMLAPIAVALTVDRDNQLKMYTINHEQCELVMRQQLNLDGAEDRVSALNFFIKAKTIIVSTEGG